LACGPTCSFFVDVAEILDSTKRIDAPNSQIFSKEIRKYIDSNNSNQHQVPNQCMNDEEDDEDEDEDEINLLQNTESHTINGMAMKMECDDSDVYLPSLWPVILQV
jgi:hypothetical protein